MEMDLHPIIVHFPIALLTLYSLLEVASLRTYFRSASRTHTKIFLLFTWTLWSLAALSSGERAAELFGDMTLLLYLHEQAAETTMLIYKGISVFYLIKLTLAHSSFVQIVNAPGVLTFFAKTITRIQRLRLPALAAVVWFIWLNVTWGFGGMLVYWPNSDPITKILYQAAQELDARYTISEKIEERNQKDSGNEE